MPAPKRRAHGRTAAAVAEDLMMARWSGGLFRADANVLRATLDWLSVTDTYDGQEPLPRARDLLLHYTKRVCGNRPGEADSTDTTGPVAAQSLEALLLRSSKDTRLAEVVRREASTHAPLVVSPDAIRHREDRLIREIADQVAQDLSTRRTDVPQTVEAAVHKLAPIVVDLRQDLHDLLCVTYPDVPSPDPRDRRVVERYFELTGVALGELLVAAVDLETVGYRQADLSRFEFALVNFARRMADRLFGEGDDRDWMLDFTRSNRGVSLFDRYDLLKASERGRSLHQRWVEWAQSCYSTCAFERTTDTNYMCSPHAFLTQLYDFEAGYVAFGYARPEIEGNEPPRHYGLSKMLRLAARRIDYDDD